MKQISQEESEHCTPERGLGNTDRNAEEAEMGVGADSQARTPDKTDWPPDDVFPQGLMAGEKGSERSYAFPFSVS